MTPHESPSCLVGAPENAPAERASIEAVRRQYEIFLGAHCREFLDCIPTAVLVLNSLRQVVFANEAGLDFLHVENLEAVQGLRPGEALDCANAHAGRGGCGTSSYCSSCKALAVILAAIDGHETRQHTALLRRGEDFLENLELMVSATPLRIGTERFVVFSASNASHQVRRRNLERIFFHDVLNLAGGINGLVELLSTSLAPQAEAELKILREATATLVDEIVAQRELLAAESNDLRPLFGSMNTRALLVLLSGLHGNSASGQGQTIRVDEASTELLVETDVRLVRRVLGNMIKNALEAGMPGDCVAVDCRDEGERVRFEVRNAAVIPEDVRQSIFRRRVSTKGDGRGVGTYSMLLLAERYLDGEVGFSSTEGQGTRFYLLLPKRVERA